MKTAGVSDAKDKQEASDRWGLFFDISKIYSATSETGADFWVSAVGIINPGFGVKQR